MSITFDEIALALARDYNSIYVIDAHDDSYVEYLAEGGDRQLVLRASGSDFYKDAILDCRESVHPDDRDEFLRLFSKENIMGILKTGESFSFTFRLILGTETAFYFFKTIKGSEDTVIVAVKNIDDNRKKEMAAEEEMRTYRQLATALTSRYEVIYRVNIHTNEYTEFSSSEKYTKLQVGTSGEDFFADTQRNMKHDIYEEDYPMMAEAMVKENILAKLAKKNKIQINYRLLLDGRPQYVSLIIVRRDDDADHIIVAVENIDEVKRREVEFEAKIGSAIDMANKDALTGVKNKHAYVTAESELDELISKDPENLEFAIAVCDLNGLKQVNDDLGHSAGDTYIKDACANICEIFDHSPVYRIGGDEFVVILKGNDYLRRYDLIKRFYNHQVDNRHKGLVTMAYGMAEFMPGNGLRMQDVFERADTLMYENKKHFKEQPVNEEAQSIESYSFIRFYELYEQLLTAMVDFENVDVPLVSNLIAKMGRMFRLSKGVTKVYKNPREEEEGGGETYIPFDTDKECYEVLSLRVVTSVLSSATCTIYMTEDEVPLSPEELEKVELVMRTVLSFVSRNKLRTIVYELAYFDENGYPNLRSLNRELGNLMKGTTAREKMAVRYNLRHFSIINQEFGREAGDRIIRQHYETLLGIMGEGGFIARLGGDNFVGICSKDKADKVASFLSEVILRVDDHSSVRIRTSAGIFIPVDDFKMHDPGEVMGAIINAYNVAQSGGGERIVFFDDKLMAQKQKNARIQRKLAEALRSHEVRPFYQPKVNADTGEIVGGEALCRWYHDGKIVPPDEFIPALEQTSDICDLDFYMLDHVCSDQRAWLDGGEGRTLVPMSINFSRKHIMNMELADTIEMIIDKYNIPHDAIEIELTETTTDVEFSDLKRVVTQLRDKGIRTSIDDFGIGYSSLNLLRDIPWHTLKIDRSFIPEESDGTDSVKYKMFCGVLGMAKTLGITCVAEGVETASQLKIMRDTGCDIIQGYYFDKPLPREDFESRLVTKKYDK